MIRFNTIFFFLLLWKISYSQEGLNLSLNSTHASSTSAIFVDDNKAYIMASTFDTTKIAVLKGIFYKINLESNTIEDSIEINTNPIGFDPRSSKLFRIADTLHYFAYGIEWRDTIVNNQNNFTFYHHFRYNLRDGTWSNNTFPAVDDVGYQFVRHSDAYITETNVYLANVCVDPETERGETLITKLSHTGEIDWNLKYEREILHGVRKILQDKNKDVLFCGSFFEISNDRRDGYNHLFVYKVDSEDGSIISKFTLDEDTTLPRAIIEDPNGGYIIESGDAEFLEGFRLPAITRILKIDENLDTIVWELPLSDSLSMNPFGHINNFTSLGNNEFLAVGVSDMIKPNSHVGRIVKFTGDGELIFDKEIQFYEPQDDLEQRLTDIVQYKDGFIACGTILSYTSDFIIPRQHGWVVYIDKNGNTDISSSSELITVDKGIVKVFPNPTSTEIFLKFENELIEFSNYFIYSINGKIVQSGQLIKGMSEVNIPLNFSQKGSYILRIQRTDSSITKIFYVQ